MKKSKTKRIFEALLFAIVTPIIIPFIIPVLYLKIIIDKLKGK